MVLKQAGANIDEAAIPGTRDLAQNYCDPKEYLGPSFSGPCTEEQQTFLRRNRNLFTSGEDNLVLRGVNLYGEKQWILIADRYLPDRSVNIISQRYSKLCLMLYKAHGIDIDPKGNLKPPPKLESVDDIDEEKVTELGLQAVNPPAILNVHRWSLEEDLTLLKAVPLMGHMWAELGARLIPHRDRGHLRKRYQVLERRVKATVARSAKGEGMMMKSSTKSQPPHRKTPAPVKSMLTKAAATKGSPLKNANNTHKSVIPIPEKVNSTKPSVTTKSTSSRPSSTAKLPTSAAKSIAKSKFAVRKSVHATKTNATSKAAAVAKTRSPGASSTAKQHVTRVTKKKLPLRKHTAPTVPDKDIQKAAASLAFLRPPSKNGTVDSGSSAPAPAPAYAPAPAPAYAPAPAPVNTNNTNHKVPEHTAEHHPHPPPYPGHHGHYPPHPYYNYHHHYYHHHPPPGHYVHYPPPRPGTQYPPPPARPHPSPPAPAPTKPPSNSASAQKSTKPSKPAEHADKVQQGSSLSSAAKSVECHMNAEQSCSRAAFERLLESTNDEWSQMSRVKKMMENDTESLVADAIVNQLPKSPGPSDLSKLPQMHLDSNSLSGLSVLQSEPAGTQPSTGRSTTSQSDSSGIGLMASVLERTSKGDDGTSKAKKAATKPPLPPSKSGEQQSQDHHVLHSMLSPRKRPATNGVAPSTPAQPTTPRNAFFSVSGTPLGLSPGFRPFPSGADGDGRKLPGFSLTPNRAPFSPGPSSMALIYSGDDDDTGGGFKFSDFDVSKQGAEGEGATKTAAPNTPSGNSFLLDDGGFSRTARTPEEIEVTSCLFSLSHSPPGKSNNNNNKNDGAASDDDRDQQQQQQEEQPTQRLTKKKSLFEKVVGGFKDPKKKLEF